jgi:hypothetical protein
MSHSTRLHNFADRIASTVLERILANFILLINNKQIFFGTDSRDSGQPTALDTTPAEPN